jgi:oligopeptide transport system substrate-binding protein
MKANEANSTDENEVYPSFLSFTIEESDSDIRDMFKDEKLDSITTLNKNSFEKKKYTITSSQSITLGLIFNSSDKLCANQNFKNSLIYGINRESLRNQTNDDVTPAYGIIPPAVTLLGRSYRELSSDIIYNIYDEDKAVSFCEAAKDELNAESFGTIRLLVCTGSVDSSYLHILTREWQDLLGFYVSIEEVTEDEYEERIESGDYQIALYSVRGKYNSGISVLEQLAADENIGISADTKTYISNLRRCANSSDLVTQFSSAEQQVLDELTFVPIFYKNTYLIAESENRDIKFDGFSGAADYREAKHFD